MHLLEAAKLFKACVIKKNPTNNLAFVTNIRKTLLRIQVPTFSKQLYTVHHSSLEFYFNAEETFFCYKNTV